MINKILSALLVTLSLYANADGALVQYGSFDCKNCQKHHQYFTAFEAIAKKMNAQYLFAPIPNKQTQMKDMAYYSILAAKPSLSRKLIDATFQTKGVFLSTNAAAISINQHLKLPTDTPQAHPAKVRGFYTALLAPAAELNINEYPTFVYIKSNGQATVLTRGADAETNLKILEKWSNQ